MPRNLLFLHNSIFRISWGNITQTCLKFIIFTSLIVPLACYLHKYLFYFSCYCFHTNFCRNLVFLKALCYEHFSLWICILNDINKRYKISVTINISVQTIKNKKKCKRDWICFTGWLLFKNLVKKRFDTIREIWL